MSKLMAGRKALPLRQGTATFYKMSPPKSQPLTHKVGPTLRPTFHRTTHQCDISKYLARFLSVDHPPKSDTVECWKCQNFLSKDFSHAICSKCKSLRQPPPIDHLDYFKLFDLEKSYNVDTKLLADKFKSLQKVFHPDIYAQKSEKEKSISETWSSLVNGGYVTLQKPHLRANYLLHLYGESLEENEFLMDSEFLSQMMELNEEISEAEQIPDVNNLMDKIKESLDNYDRSIAKAFEEKDIAAARKNIAEMQYYVNLKQKLILKETDMGIVH